MEAARLAFAEFVDTEQERTSDEELTEQRGVLLVHKAADEELMQVEADRDRADREKEHQAVRLHELDRIAEEHMEQFQKDQEMLREIANDEQKVRAAKLLVEAGQREVQECNKALDMLQKQKEALWACLEKKKAEMEAEQDRWIQAGEEESRVDIMMDTSDMDCSIVAEQGQLPKAITAVEEQAYHHLVLVEMNQIQWKYEALSYLTSIIKGNQEAWDQGTET